MTSSASPALPRRLPEGTRVISREACGRRHAAAAKAGEDTTMLVHAAADGDDAAWSALVDRFSGLVWAVTRSTHLRDADAADVYQTTWLRLVEHLDRIENPERVGAWLATTARRECYRVGGRSRRDVLTGDEWAFDGSPEHDAPIDEPAIIHERDLALHAAFLKLPARSRRLLLLLNADPSYSYAEISRILGMPVGSIGPTRARVLAALRGHVGSLGLSQTDLCA
jgi:RNA polymerase sigma factor (sigma-70 family)